MAAAKIKVEYSEHATERLKERGITRKAVTECLFEGDLIGFDLRGRKMNQVIVGRKSLIVVFTDGKDGSKVVITAYWKGIYL